MSKERMCGADLIVVLQQGRILDAGSHAHLIDRCALYKRLIQLQMTGEPALREAVSTAECPPVGREGEKPINSQPLKRIVMGCRKDFHSGFHPKLQASPPHGFEFTTCDAEHVFLFAEGHSGSPHGEFHFGEFVDFGNGQEVVHSAIWPVLKRRAWVVDMNDFGYPALSGRHALDPRFQETFAGPWRAQFRSDLEQRLGNMTAAYAHPSCRGVLFWTRNALKAVLDWAEVFGNREAAEALLSKAHVVLPAFPAAAAAAVDQKWSSTSPLRVVFCGRDFAEKNGELALRVLGRVANDFRDRVHCTYVGHIPGGMRPELREALSRIEHFSALPHEQMLSLLEHSHVLFHPSRSESLGLVMIEAAANGLAVVAAKGHLMDHMDDLFDAQAALLLDRNAVGSEEEEGLFEQFLRRLVEHPESAEAMGRRNYKSAAYGRLSPSRRNEILCRVYADAMECPAPRGLSLGDLPFAEGRQAVTLSRTYVDADLRTVLARRGMRQRYVVLEKSFESPRTPLH